MLSVTPAFRCEFEVPNTTSFTPGDPPGKLGWSLLASTAAKQRTEVRLSELSVEEKLAFEKAKQTEIQNWIQTESLTKVFRDQIPPEQVLRCRWI